MKSNNPNYYFWTWLPNRRKSVKDSGRRYSVNVFGMVWSHPKKRGTNAREDGGKYLNTVTHSSGYLTVKLYRFEKKKSVVKRHYVHKLVADAFVPNPHGFKFVHHIDGDKRNCHKNNLAWVSQSMLKRVPTGFDEVSSFHWELYARINRFHSLNIRLLHRDGKSLEDLSELYRIPVFVISWIITNSGGKILDEESRKEELKKAAESHQRFLEAMRETRELLNRQRQNRSSRIIVSSYDSDDWLLDM